MKKYDNYKDSGEEWLGEMPSHWNLSSIKFLAKIQNGSTPSSSNDEYWNGDVNWVTTDDLGKLVNKEITETRRTITKLGYESCGTSLAPIDSIVISTRAPIGHIGILKIEASTNQGCKTIIPLKVNSLFCYYYFLNSKEVLQSLGQGSTFKELPTSTLKDFKIVFPSSIEEQTAIANYLDHKTSQIDHLIAKKEQFIKLLEEERVAVINKVVTKGLDPNVPMKDSGIEWLGEIPEHWKITKLKYHLKTTKGFAFKSDLFTDKGIPVVKASDIKNKTIRLETTHYISEIISKEYESVRLSQGDILISTVGSTPDVINSAVGQIGMVPFELEGALLNQNTVRLEISDKSILLNDFLFFLIQNDNYRSYLNLNAHGTANQASLKLVDILGFETSFPSIEEQQKIINHIGFELNRFDKIISKSQQEIELLKEYKTALISEVVTGKVDVRNEKQN